MRNQRFELIIHGITLAQGQTLVDAGSVQVLYKESIKKNYEILDICPKRRLVGYF